MEKDQTRPGNQTRSLVKVLLPIGLILAATVGTLTVLRKQAAEPVASNEAKVGAILPDLELQEFKGEKKKLSQLPGKVRLINFWATWCASCVVEIPSILKLRETFNSRGLEVAFINVDDSPDTVVPGALTRLGITFSTFVDPNFALSDFFDVHGIPLTVIVDQNRKVRLIELGERDWNAKDIHALMEQWLTE